MPLVQRPGFAQTFAPPSKFAFTGPSSIATGDLNGDHKIDLVVGGDYELKVFLGRGDGSFEPGPVYSVDLAASITLADFNEDGEPDLVVACQGAAGVYVLLGRGNGSFDGPVRYPAGPYPRSVAVGDFNCDGHGDLAVASRGSDFTIPMVPGGVWVLLGKGDGTFQSGTAYAVDVETNPYSVAIGDFDKNGKLDLVVANHGVLRNAAWYRCGVSVLLGDGAGSFLVSSNYAVGNGPGSVIVQDLDGDGCLDFAVSNEGGTVSAAFGSGYGTFTNLCSYSGLGLSCLSAADFDGDGITDLAANSGGDLIRVLRGKGDGTFLEPATSIAGGPLPYFIAPGDFNGDGRPDLAVASYRSNTVSVMLNASTESPALHIASVNQTIALSWPFPSTGFLLEAASFVDAAEWRLVSQPPAAISGRLCVSVPATNSGTLFRLHRY